MSHDDERGGLLSELDDVTRLAARAANAPDNFLHLLRLVEAERAWITGDRLITFERERRMNPKRDNGTQIRQPEEANHEQHTTLTNVAIAASGAGSCLM